MLSLSLHRPVVVHPLPLHCPLLFGRYPSATSASYLGRPFGGPSSSLDVSSLSRRCLFVVPPLLRPCRYGVHSLSTTVVSMSSWQCLSTSLRRFFVVPPSSHCCSSAVPLVSLRRSVVALPLYLDRHFEVPSLTMVRPFAVPLLSFFGSCVVPCSFVVSVLFRCAFVNIGHPFAGPFVVHSLSIPCPLVHPCLSLRCASVVHHHRLFVVPSVSIRCPFHVQGLGGEYDLVIYQGIGDPRFVNRGLAGIRFRN